MVQIAIFSPVFAQIWYFSSPVDYETTSFADCIFVSYCSETHLKNTWVT
jgi:hypothetical protein